MYVPGTRALDHHMHVFGLTKEKNRKKMVVQQLTERSADSKVAGKGRAALHAAVPHRLARSTGTQSSPE